MSGLLQERLGHHAKRLGITISFSHEEVPMDTAGPLALARKLITEGNNGEPFFVMNADVTADFPFKQMLEFHKVKKITFGWAFLIHYTVTVLLKTTPVNSWTIKELYNLRPRVTKFHSSLN